MNYEKKYKEALDRVKELLSRCINHRDRITKIYRVEDIESIFPELAESEDERIRKWCILHFKAAIRVTKDNAEYQEYLNNKVIPWLEKQSEKKFIWHDESEEPERDKLILLIMQSGTPIVAKVIEPNHTFNHGERWAYIDDLIEKQGEQKTFDYGNVNIKQKDYMPKDYSSIDPYFGKQIEMRPSWSEEDMSKVQRICKYLNEVKKYYADITEVRECIEWLKSIKDRIGFGLICTTKELESSDEQKPIDKVEPKFKVGDWISDGENVWKIEGIRQVDYFLQSQSGGAVNAIISYVDEHFHLWTIKDAKEGDVLYHSDTASNGIFIFKGLLKHEFSEEVICYCDYDSEDGFCLGEYHTCCWSDAKILHPATKEKRDLLFQEMRESGYKWDAENKELKNILNYERTLLDNQM